MNIGFTYDLKNEYLAEGVKPEDAAEFDKPDTIDGIEQAIRRLGHTVDRIGRLSRLTERLAAGDRWDLVFNIAEGRYGAGREAQIPALLEGYGIPVTFGDSVCLALCLHKAYCKSIVQWAGIPTPAFAVIEYADDALRPLSLPFPLFAKPVAEGTGKGIDARARIEDPTHLGAICASLLDRFRQPVLVEEFLPGREFTVGILGTGRKAWALGVMEVHLLDNAEEGAYTFDNKDNYEDRVRYSLARDAEAQQAMAIALDAYRLLGCRDGGRIDLRSDANGVPNFIEANPLAGLNPVHSDLPILGRLVGVEFDHIIAAIVASASERVGV